MLASNIQKMSQSSKIQRAIKAGTTFQLLWRKLLVGTGASVLGFYFCLGKVRQIHEVEAVESPHAETEPVVVFLTLALTPTH